MQDNEYTLEADEAKVYWISGKTASRIMRLMRRGRARAGGGCQELVTDSGTFITAAAVTDIVVPFTPADVTTYDDGGVIVTRKILISYGYVEDAIKSTLGMGDALWVPTGMTEDDGLTIENGADDAGAVYLRVTNSVDPVTGKGEITALDIIAHSYDDDPLETDTGVEGYQYGYKYICDWETTDEGKQRIVNSGGIGHQAWLYANQSFFWPAAVV